jgi:hypothetical protein
MVIMKKRVYALLIAALAAAYLPAATHAEFREEGIAIIELKGPNALQLEASSFEHFIDRYMLVSDLTRIYNEVGERIGLDALGVPCQARILYKKRASDGLSEAISINVEYSIEGRPPETDWGLPEIQPLPPQ